MIRGAVAFGLVLRIDTPNKEVIVTTSLALVIFTTVFMGSTVSTVQRAFFGKFDKCHPLSEILEEADKSNHEEFLHPNFA